MIEHPDAFQFIINEDIYLLPEDKINPGKKSDRKEETPQLTFNYEGNNKKRFLILTHYKEDGSINPLHLAALQSILTRKGYDIDDVAILNLAHNPADFLAIKTHFLPARLLVLGHDALAAGLPALNFNQKQRVEDIEVLHSFAFADMMENTDNKRSFWEQMKSL